MTISFKVHPPRTSPDPRLRNTVHLVQNDWDDYSFKTTFYITFTDQDGVRVSLGSVKIGYVGQGHGWTKDKLPPEFPDLDDSWFSLGQDADYYRTAFASLSEADRRQIFEGLRDVVFDPAAYERARGEKVFKESLTRGVSDSVLFGQFKRILAGDVALTDFHFAYEEPGDEKRAPVRLTFKVAVNSKPSTNVHVLIGRNGVGKTTILNNMVLAFLDQTSGPGRFYEVGAFGKDGLLPADYFSCVVSVSFSAFDPFDPPADRQEPSSGPRYFYVGMKRRDEHEQASGALPPKGKDDLIADFIASFKSCRGMPEKRARWLAAIERLQSDENFSAMNLAGAMAAEDDEAACAEAQSIAKRMSSGHSIVLLTMTKLVDTVEEKSLVLLDEPESHLHPPLLSAFTRALADLLHNRNGVAIVATHSPVVVQEVPRRCVWKLTRHRLEGRADRPERETFGENVGILTREIFGLEVEKSGFHHLLAQDVAEGKTFEQVMSEYRDSLGLEAQAILRALIGSRNARRSTDETSDEADD